MYVLSKVHLGNGITEKIFGNPKHATLNKY